ncbi:hypothetical protein WJX79_010056 [Trebouxia sp. C0005]
MQTIMMLGCHPRTTMKTKMSEPPPGAMKALLQTVFLLIHRSQWIHESSCSAVIEARQSADEALKIWKPEANQTRTLLMSLVRVLQLALNQDIWMSARAALGPWSWCPDKQAPIKLKRWLRKLTAVNALSSVTADEVEQCFVIRQDEASAEASALKVAAELLAEEEQAAVRAAVKKAKKLRQKQAKKQQPQAVKTHSGSCAAKASDVECSAQHADAIFLKKLFCCPITQSVMVDPMIAADGRTYERSAMEECHGRLRVTLSIGSYDKHVCIRCCYAMDRMHFSSNS